MATMILDRECIGVRTQITGIRETTWLLEVKFTHVDTRLLGISGELERPIAEHEGLELISSLYPAMEADKLYMPGRDLSRIQDTVSWECGDLDRCRLQEKRVHEVVRKANKRLLFAQLFGGNIARVHDEVLVPAQPAVQPDKGPGECPGKPTPAATTGDDAWRARALELEAQLSGLKRAVSRALRRSTRVSVTTTGPDEQRAVWFMSTEQREELRKAVKDS